MISSFTQRRRFSDLSEQDVLALAISSEEDDARIYRSYAQMLRADYPASAQVFDAMAVEEDGHRQLLIDMHRTRFGEVIPLIRREHVAGFHARRPIWLTKNLSLDTIRGEASGMEAQAAKFYTLAAGRTSDAATRKLLGDLAAAEAGHEKSAVGLEAALLNGDARAEEDAGARRQFILTWVQPGLAGLMDGSVSTLAPIFATAFATQNTHTTLLVGLAASVGAGQSVQAGAGVGIDDDLWRLGPCAALSDPRFLDRHGLGHVCGVCGTLGDCVDSKPLHGHALCARGLAGGAGRGFGLWRGRVDWRRLRAVCKAGPAPAVFAPR